MGLAITDLLTEAVGSSARGGDRFIEPTAGGFEGLILVPMWKFLSKPALSLEFRDGRFTVCTPSSLELIIGLAICLVLSKMLRPFSGAIIGLDISWLEADGFVTSKVP
jgi:hypothetical protein